MRGGDIDYDPSNRSRAFPGDLRARVTKKLPFGGNRKSALGFNAGIRDSLRSFVMRKEENRRLGE